MKTATKNTDVKAASTKTASVKKTTAGKVPIKKGVSAAASSKKLISPYPAQYFSHIAPVSVKIARDGFGIRGRRALELAEMKLPVLPGILFDASIADTLSEVNYERDIAPHFKLFAGIVEKRFADAQEPQLVKIVFSPNMVIANYPVVHNAGLAKDTIDGFASKVGVDFTANELLFLMRGLLSVQLRTAQLTEAAELSAHFDKALKKVADLIEKPKKDLVPAHIIAQFEEYFPQGFFDSAIRQIELALEIISAFLRCDVQNEKDTALLIQPMVYGNYTKDSCSGDFATRDVINGEKKLQGQFFEQKFNEVHTDGKDINKIAPTHLKELQKVASLLEDTFKEIRQVRFTIENNTLWLIEQKSVDKKSTAAQIQLLLDLHARKIIDEEILINSLKPEQMSEILHPIIDMASTKKLPCSEGGISGAPGAAVGRVYFSTEALLEAQLLAKQKSQDVRCILLMSATYAGDVKAIEAGSGVLSNEGGYAAHASVVARQYGKTSLVRPDMKIIGKRAKLGDMVITEGEYITLYVPYYGKPMVFKGEAALSQPNPKECGILDIVAICKKHIGNFTVRANADSPRDAQLALQFGADGIGLCRTEHMFFHEERINIFRQMILASDEKERKTALAKLQKIQTGDFYKMFKIMEGKQVTIRLLDAPLHEFLPHNSAEFGKFMEVAGNTKSKAEVEASINAMEEFNPMLGHRGCRIAVSYPTIYEMQMRSIFEAACKLQKEKIDVSLEIMIPIIMNQNELKLVIYGKKIEGHTYTGLIDIAEAVCKEQGVSSLEYKVGTMIELPAAALGAAEIAKYAQFFSFGTNDLTQTTLGLSRDDFNSFMPDYTMYDLIEGNPFATLDPRVKELIAIASIRGTASRPDLVKGLCGEHGARPENIKFCIETG